MTDLNGKIAIITGAGSGLGKAAAQLFVNYGATIYCADISGAQNEVAACLGDAATPMHCDVAREDDVQALIDAAVGQFGRLDAMLNVAGVSLFQEIATLDMADYDRIMDIDLRGVVHGTKHAVRAMQGKGGGSILNWASVAALGAKPGTGIYSAAKTGIVAVTRAAATEYGHLGIRTNAILPGLFLTEAAAQAPKEMIDGLTATIPLKRGGEPTECAELAAFLVSDKARFINGAAIVIDGGQSAQLA